MSSLPEFKGLTKGEPQITADELREAIIKRAKEDAASGASSTDNLKEITKLIEQYTCSVSPDRAGIIAAGSSGMTFPTGMTNAVVASVEDKDTGAIIAQCIAGQGWVTYNTKEETELENEFYRLYRETFYGKNTDNSSSSSVSQNSSTTTTKETVNSPVKIDYEA